MPSERTLVIAALIAAAGTAGAIVFARSHRKDPHELPKFGSMPAFEATAHTGAKITDESLRGKVIIANFIFTRCDTVCPTLTQKMRHVQDLTDDLAGRMLIVSFSVDPEYDTPQRLDEYAKRFGADSSRWWFLTGDPKKILETVSEGLKIAVRDQGNKTASGSPDIVHGEQMILFDQNLRIRGYYSGTNFERVDELILAARYLATPKRRR